MATKLGRIARVGRRGSTFVEIYLDGGDRVELPHDLMASVMSRYAPDEVLAFVERRKHLFMFVQWVGTPGEALDAMHSGVLRSKEVPPEVQFLATLRAQHGSEAAYSHFLSRLSDLVPGDWVQIVMSVPTAEYEDESKPGRQALRALSTSPQGELAALVLRVTSEADEVFGRAFPSMASIREHLRPFAAPGTERPSGRDYELLREGGNRRTVPAALSLAVKDRLSVAELYGVYRPFQVVIPLASLGIRIPEFEDRR